MKTLLAIALLGYVAGGVSNAEAAATLKGRNKVLAECTQQAMTMGLAKKTIRRKNFIMDCMTDRGYQG
jgi:hypothetical protein